jgi:DNA anti-recombination protein RmuC
MNSKAKEIIDELERILHKARCLVDAANKAQRLLVSVHKSVSVIRKDK